MRRFGLITPAAPSFTFASGGRLIDLGTVAEQVQAGTWPRGPAAPTSLAATGGNASLPLTWTAPATTYGTLTNYLVEYTPSGGSAATVLTGSTSGSYMLTGLTNGTAYSVRVAAVNHRAGDWSGTVSGTPSSASSLSATGYSGAGTLASKLAPPASPSSFTSSPSISVGIGGTLNVSIASIDSYNDAWAVQIKRNGTTVYENDANLANGTTTTVSVTAGQTITLVVSGGGAAWLAGTRLWVS